MNYKQEFKKAVLPCLKSQAVKVKLTEKEQKKIYKTVLDIIKAKGKEKGYNYDNKKMKTRFYTGLAGEMAVQKLIKKEFIDLTVGNSNYYNHADLKKVGINVGVKTIKYGNFPVIHNNAKRPEIICMITGVDTVYILGLATKDVLNKYQDDKYILSPWLRKKGTKTCFYGFDY
ncbi:MAG: hypothetical protein ACOCUI_04215, partial [bacterium]